MACCCYFCPRAVPKRHPKVQRIERKECMKASSPTCHSDLYNLTIIFGELFILVFFCGRFWNYLWVPGYAFLLLCFSAFCFSCFSASLLFCFCALPASFLFCFSAFPAFLLLCFCAFLLLLFYLFFLQACVFVALLPAPLLFCFLSLLPLCFFCYFALLSPVCKHPR